ncbi:MAG: 30S ribosome-binding factor RbfA [Erysipelotrichaceae bacterium]
MKIKQERLANIIYRNLAEIIQFKLNDPDVGLITITEVKVTGDLSVAKVFYVVHGNQFQKDRCLKALIRAKGFIRSELAQHLSTYKTPDLKFIYDDNLDKANRIEELIKQANKKTTD